MYVVVVQCADDGSELSETFGPFDTKQSAVRFAKRDCMAVINELNGDDKRCTDVEMLHENDRVYWEGGMSWVISKMTKPKK